MTVSLLSLLGNRLMFNTDATSECAQGRLRKAQGERFVPLEEPSAITIKSVFTYYFVIIFKSFPVFFQPLFFHLHTAPFNYVLP